MKEELDRIDDDVRSFELQALSSLRSICTIRRRYHHPFPDYELLIQQGKVKRVSDFLGSDPRMYIIHNMGNGCPYCAAYADGFNGILSHLRSVGKVLLVSPDLPDTLMQFAIARRWEFDIASVNGTRFSSDVGFEDSPGEYKPGVLLVERRDDRLFLAARYGFEPGDHFSPLWPMLALAGISESDWQPMLSYKPK